MTMFKSIGDVEIIKPESCTNIFDVHFQCGITGHTVVYSVASEMFTLLISMLKNVRALLVQQCEWIKTSLFEKEKHTDYSAERIRLAFILREILHAATGVCK